MRPHQAFTLLEVLLSVSLIAALAALSTPVFRMFQVKNNLDNAAVTVAQTWRRSQVLSQAAADDSSWGTYVQVGSITLFKGVSYISRDTDWDEVFPVAGNITPTGLQEVVFSRFYGLPQATGTLSFSAFEEVRTVNINAKGTVGY